MFDPGVGNLQNKEINMTLDSLKVQSLKHPKVEGF